MKIKVLFTGKTNEAWIREGVAQYAGRIAHYLPFEIVETPDLDRMLKTLRPADVLVLLDERGETFTSPGLARYLEEKAAHLPKDLVFAIGGPYGFSQAVRERSNGQISLSKMTFSHQLVRVVFVEQLYRALTIIKGEPYHHE